MSKYVYDGDKQIRPISAWGYIGYSILFAIPIIGLILLIVFAFSDRNINRRNYARSFFCWLIIGIIIAVLMSTGIVSSIMGSSFEAKMTAAQNSIQDYMKNGLHRIAKSTSSSKPTEGKGLAQDDPAKTKDNALSNGNSEGSPASPLFDNESTEENASQDTKNPTYEYTLKEGKYIIGKDIVPGNYTIYCTETAGESVGNAYGSLGNMMDAVDDKSNGSWSDLYGSLGNLMGEYIGMTVEILGDYGDVLRSYDMKKDDSISILLEEGTAIKITDGSCKISSK